MSVVMQNSIGKRNRRKLDERDRDESLQNFEPLPEAVQKEIA